jgi:hypothetical protein
MSLTMNKSHYLFDAARSFLIKKSTTAHYSNFDRSKGSLRYKT